MDLASILGMVICIVLVLIAIVAGDGVAALKNFGDFKSILIVLGGAFCATMASYSMKDFINGLKSFTLILRQPELNTTELIVKIIDLSNVARKEGLLSLEEAAADLDDAFLKKVYSLLSMERIQNWFAGLWKQSW